MILRLLQATAIATNRFSVVIFWGKDQKKSMFKKLFFVCLLIVINISLDLNTFSENLVLPGLIPINPRYFGIINKI